MAALIVAAVAASTFTAEGPCDIFDAAPEGTPCVAAHSMVRALYGAYRYFHLSECVYIAGRWARCRTRLGVSVCVCVSCGVGEMGYAAGKMHARGTVVVSSLRPRTAPVTAVIRAAGCRCSPLLTLLPREDVREPIPMELDVYVAIELPSVLLAAARS